MKITYQISKPSLWKSFLYVEFKSLFDDALLIGGTFVNLVGTLSIILSDGIRVLSNDAKYFFLFLNK